jgi:hypothetical protein
MTWHSTRRCLRYPQGTRGTTPLTQHFQIQKRRLFLVNFIVVIDPSPAPSMAPTSKGNMGACCFIRPTKLRPGVFWHYSTKKNTALGDQPPHSGGARLNGKSRALPVSFPNNNQPGRRGRGGVEEGTTCPNFPNNNQPQCRGWRRGLSGGEAGAAAGRRSTPRRCPALWRGCTGPGAAPPSSRRRRTPRVRPWFCTAGTWRQRARACWTAWRGKGSSPPRRESGGARAATPVAVVATAATTTSGARPPGRGGTGPPRGGGEVNGTVTCANCCLTLGYVLDCGPVQGEPLVRVEPTGSTPSLYYNPPGQFWE